MINETYEQLWDASILKWRGVSLEDFKNIDFRLGRFPTFDIGAEVYFMHDNKCVCSKINKIEVGVFSESSSIRYYVDDKAGGLDDGFVFASKEELKEHLMLERPRPLPLDINPYLSGEECYRGKGYGASSFRTSTEDIKRTGYSIKQYDIQHRIGSKFWVMDNNTCVQHLLNHIKLEITQDKCIISYGLEFNVPRYYMPTEIYQSKKELIDTL